MILMTRIVTKERGNESVTVADRLVKARGGRRREEVAEAVGVSLSAISMYENGGRIPRDETKIKLANYYGMSVQELFFDSECHEK